MNIRDENSHDWTAVYQVVTSAFGQSAEAKLVGELRDAGDSVISLVAEQDGQVVGHVLLSRMDAPFPALALAPVSVTPRRQRSGIGSALIKSAVDRARSEGWAAIFVLGDPNYYARFGFDRAAATGFTSVYAGWCSISQHRFPRQPARYTTRQRSVLLISPTRHAFGKNQTETPLWSFGARLINISGRPSRKNTPSSTYRLR